MRTEPTRVSWRTRLARIWETSGEVSCHFRPINRSALFSRPRQGRGLRVRGRMRQRVDRGSTHRMVGQRIRMHGDEQRRAPRLRPVHPVIQRDENVACAGQFHTVAAAGLELALQLQGGGQRDVLFISAGMPIAPGSLPPCPGSSMTKGRGGLVALASAPFDPEGEPSWTLDLSGHRTEHGARHKEEGADTERRRRKNCQQPRRRVTGKPVPCRPS